LVDANLLDESIVAEFGSGFALLPTDVLDGELIESPFHIAKTHGSFVYSNESNLRPTAGPPPFKDNTFLFGRHSGTIVRSDPHFWES
jgi:hypothetical protein